MDQSSSDSTVILELSSVPEKEDISVPELKRAESVFVHQQWRERSGAPRRSRLWRAISWTTSTLAGFLVKPSVKHLSRDPQRCLGEGAGRQLSSM
ncbi:hypothetical protein PFLUV_G00209270 [Perca fluviatilis]|uniref:Uncharacterized protein n=1 Tax=Perca fluviatilis TaxID=8168 RepID=A0A6A5ED83_PERFL|nr:hypothetical protein PFLUV_G00209260 [Perca fluviatilis]KAF1376279.1 hypothetical protein PFLUV_G00209270 [Perca fluviatilis]